MFKNIITHNGKRHFDDLMAVSLALTLYPEAVVRCFNQQSIPKEYFTDESAIFVDCGGKYDGKRFFDHHQGSQCNTSFVVVLKDLFKIDKTILFETFPSLKNADLKDRFGMKQFLNNEKSNIIDFSFPENILTSLYESAGDVILPGSEIHKILIIFGKEILKIINGKINAIKIIKENNIIIQNGELTALAVNSTIIGDAAFIKRTIGQKDADLLIVPNMTDENKTSVVKIGIKQDHIDLKRLDKLVNISFLHANGFMAVLDRPFDYMFAEEVLNVL